MFSSPLPIPPTHSLLPKHIYMFDAIYPLVRYMAICDRCKTKTKCYMVSVRFETSRRGGVFYLCPACLTTLNEILTTTQLRVRNAELVGYYDDGFSAFGLHGVVYLSSGARDFVTNYVPTSTSWKRGLWHQGVSTVSPYDFEKFLEYV